VRVDDDEADSPATSVLLTSPRRKDDSSHRQVGGSCVSIVRYRIRLIILSVSDQPVRVRMRHTAMVTVMITSADIAPAYCSPVSIRRTRGGCESTTHIAVYEDLVESVLTRGGLSRVSSAASAWSRRVWQTHRDVVVRDNDLDPDASRGGQTPVGHQTRSILTEGNVC
jgi:hypothetical protein